MSENQHWGCTMCLSCLENICGREIEKRGSESEALQLLFYYGIYVAEK